MVRGRVGLDCGARVRLGFSYRVLGCRKCTSGEARSKGEARPKGKAIST